MTKSFMHHQASPLAAEQAPSYIPCGTVGWRFTAAQSADKNAPCGGARGADTCTVTFKVAKGGSVKVSISSAAPAKPKNGESAKARSGAANEAPKNGSSTLPTSTKASDPHANGKTVGMNPKTPPEDLYRGISKDLVPYVLSKCELEGYTIAAHPVNAAVKQDVVQAMEFPHELGLKEAALPLLKSRRPSLADLSDEAIAVELRKQADVLKLASEARMSRTKPSVELFELLYDDMFAHSLVTTQDQPSRQLKDLLKPILERVANLHAQGVPHGGLALNAILYSPTLGWHLKPGTPHSEATSIPEDLRQLARILCFLGMGSESRRTLQPHQFKQMSDADLRMLIKGSADVQILAGALFAGRASATDALNFHLFHQLAVHAQALQDAKAVMRSMRLGPSDFDDAFKSNIMADKSWDAVLGGTFVPIVIRASREHVLRPDFAPFDFTSAASLLRFTANTVGHFDELGLGAHLDKAAFLDVVLAAFPALVSSAYCFLARNLDPLAHVHNRDCDLVMDAIEHDIDSVHKKMHHGLEGYSKERIWRLSDMAEYKAPPLPALAHHIPPALVKQYEKWRCEKGVLCPGHADNSCKLWHDARELKFAKEHLCTAFMEDDCHRAACPNAHGFGEIRDAMNDASPICWKWLESRCRMHHCKYAHTFRRYHTGANGNGRRQGSMDIGLGDRRRQASMDIGMATGGRRQASMDLPVGARRRQASMDVPAMHRPPHEASGTLSTPPPPTGRPSTDSANGRYRTPAERSFRVSTDVARQQRASADIDRSLAYRQRHRSVRSSLDSNWTDSPSRGSPRRSPEHEANGKATAYAASSFAPPASQRRSPLASTRTHW